MELLEWLCLHLVIQKTVVGFVEDLMGQMPDELLNFGLLVASLPQSLTL
jgi:hypothetical protein